MRISTLSRQSRFGQKPLVRLCDYTGKWTETVAMPRLCYTPRMQAPKMRFSSLLLALLTTTGQLAARTECPQPATVQIYGGRAMRKGDALVWERSIEGTANTGEGQLRHADVRLYSGYKLVRHTATDERGHFLLKDLSLGNYRLSFKGLGAFAIDLLPPHIPQQEYYTFSNYHGCLSVGFSADSN